MPNHIFSALSDPTRRKILELLAVSKKLPASEIHNHFQVSPQAISQHLKILRESNLIHVEKRAQQRIYRLNTEAMEELEGWTQQMRRMWTSRLDTMEVILEEEVRKLRRKEEDTE